MSNINVTEGSGKTVATETIAGVEYGLVKLVDATAASTTRTGVAGSPLQVSLANTATNSTAVKVDGSAATQPVSGTVSITSNSAVNVAQMNGVATSMGSGIMGTGVQRVAIASDNDALTVKQGTAANLVATVNARDGAGNALTSNSTTYSAKFGLDSNLLGTLGTAFSAAGKVDVKAADGDVFVRQATGTNLHTVIDSGTVTTVTTLTNQSQEGGVAISLNAGAVDTGTRRVIQANGAGKTIVSKSGSASTSGNNTLVSAGTNKLKVFAFTLSTSSTTAMTCKFQDGASGTDLWSVLLQAPTSITTGANLSVTPPAWLFNTSSATLLNLNLSSANAVQWSVSYYDEA